MVKNYTYTVDQPNNPPAENKRLGYRLPRSILWPPYLIVNNYFVEYTDAIDEVFEQEVDQKTEIVQGLRNMWPTNPTMESQYVNTDQLIPFEAWSQPERGILVKQVNMLGMKLMSAGLISDDSYQTISRWVGQYWFAKGTESFINFINYCLSASLKVDRLWTQDYVNFVPDNDPSIGTPIWEGGTWYPTSHVTITALGGLQNIDPQSLINFFYEIANYNLVLQALDFSYDMYIVDHLEPGYQNAKVVALGLYAQYNIVMSNFARYGANSPPTYDVGPSFPTNAWVVTDTTNPDFSGIYILDYPSAWYEQDNKIYPVYNPADQLPVEYDTSFPTTLCGGASTTGDISGYALIFGPVSWSRIPGDFRSQLRLPTLSAPPILRTSNLSQLPGISVGNKTQKLRLVNPAGFDNIAGTGQFTPYWNPTPSFLSRIKNDNFISKSNLL